MVLDLRRLPETSLPGIASKTFAWPWAQLSEMRCTDASPVRKESKGDRATPAVCALLMCVCVCNWEWFSVLQVQNYKALRGKDVEQSSNHDLGLDVRQEPSKEAKLVVSS